MEKQSNSDLEQTKERGTLTYTVGQSLLQGTPPLNILYEAEDGSKLYLYKDEEENEHYLFAHIEGKVTPSRLKEFNQVFIAVVLGLIERGLDHVCTWIKADEKDYNLATFFGFKETDYIKLFHLVNQEEPIVVHEMRYDFPELDD